MTSVMVRVYLPTLIKSPLYVTVYSLPSITTPSSSLTVTAGSCFSPLNVTEGGVTWMVGAVTVLLMMDASTEAGVLWQLHRKQYGDLCDCEGHRIGGNGSEGVGKSALQRHRAGVD